MNKFLIFVAALLMLVQFSNAQTSAGMQTLGVNFGFSTAKANENPGSQDESTGSSFVERNHSVNFGPSNSYFIANDLDIGTDLDFTSTTETDGNNNFGYPLKYNSYQFDGSVYLRKYFLFKNKFGIRTGPYIGYGKSTTKYTYTPAENFDDNNYSSNNINAGIRLDLVYYASKKLGFTATLANLQYQHYTSTGGNQLNENGNSISLYAGGTALQVSMFYIFGGKG